MKLKNNTTIKQFLIAALLLFTWSSCEWVNSWYDYFRNGQQPQEQPVARVYDKYLYPSDLKGIVSNNVNRQDSLRMLHNYIDNWIRQNLVVRLAEKNLDKKHKDIERQIEDYRNSLLTFAYEQALIRQKMDTSVSREKIREYYEKNEKAFRLQQNIAQLTYVKLNPETPKLDSARIWIRSDNKPAKEKLADYCYKYAVNFSIDPNKWYIFENITQKLPLRVEDEQRFLSANTYVERNDTAHIYLIRIMDYALKDKLAPLGYVWDDIRKIIINRRKREFIENMYQDIYQQALKKEKFEIYI